MGTPHKKFSHGTQINRLTIPQHVLLHKLVEEEYAKSGLSDTQFVEFAEKRLGFSVAASSIALARETYNILSGRDVAREKSKLTVLGRLETLEAEVKELQRLLDQATDPNRKV